MDAIKTRFLDYIQGKKQFFIPVFQRDYCWTEDQCIRLWEDLEKAKEPGHFFGTFVNVEDKGDPVLGKWLVIDGQQRLTTLTLLMTALRDHLVEIGWNCTPYPEQIEEEFLINKFQAQNSDLRFKLILRRIDDDTIRAYIESKERDEIESGLMNENHSESIRIAYECFRKKLDETQLSASDVYEKVSNLQMVLITLTYIDEPQIVFESLNSTGVDLSQSDLVRNFLLMGLEESEQTRLYENYWKIIEVYFQRSSWYLNRFLRDYVAIKKDSLTFIKDSQIYDEFKGYKRSCNLTLEEILKDLMKYAYPYAEYLFSDSSQFVKAPEELCRLRVYGDTHAILLMKLGDLRHSEKLGENEYLRMLCLIESYLLRRVVVGLPTNSYWQKFADITSKIREEAPLKSFLVALAQLSDNYQFPTDEAFRTALQEREIYRLHLRKHILDRLENHGQKEPSPTGTYSVEHIMPRTLNENWREMLGDNWEERQQTWVHRLGNLTLTGYNPKLSNRSFEEKKKIENGFEDSAVRLNKFVMNQDKWTETEIENRGRELSNRAIKIWPPLPIDVQMIREESIHALRSKATKKSPKEIEMNPEVRKLFDNIHSQISEFGEIITIAENKSICLYNPDFFVEIIPRKYYISILMLPEVSQIEDPTGIVEDANLRKTFTFATKHRDCNSYANIWTNWTSEQIFATVQIIRQAFEIADR